MRRLFVSRLAWMLVLALIVGTAACGKKYPTTPDAASSADAAAGASIAGSIVATPAAAPLSVHASGNSVNAAGWMVTVAGTSIRAMVDSGNTFMLHDVPAGDVTLVFSGPGTNASLALPAVGTTEAITISVTVAGSTASLVSSNRDHDPHPSPTPAPAPTPAPTPGPAPTPVPPEDESASIDGHLTSETGTSPVLTLMVDGTIVHTSAATIVQRRGDAQALSSLQVGQELHVEGTRLADHSIDARKISIEDDAEGGEFEIQGALGGLGGACPAVHFVVNGFTIATNASTRFDDVSCAALAPGQKVEVKGTKQADGSVVATRVKRD